MITPPTAHPEATSVQDSTTQQKWANQEEAPLSRKQMEYRRIAAAYLIGKVSKAELARAFGVARVTIYRWIDRQQKAGTLQTTRATGRPRKLTREQEQKLKIACERGITYEGLREQLAVFGVRFGKDHMRRVRIKLGIPLIKAPCGRPRD